MILSKLKKTILLTLLMSLSIFAFVSKSYSAECEASYTQHDECYDSCFQSEIKCTDACVSLYDSAMGYTGKDFSLRGAIDCCESCGNDESCHDTCYGTFFNVMTGYNTGIPLDKISATSTHFDDCLNVCSSWRDDCHNKCNRTFLSEDCPKNRIHQWDANTCDFSREFRGYVEYYYVEATIIQDRAPSVYEIPLLKQKRLLEKNLSDKEKQELKKKLKEEYIKRVLNKTK